MLVILVGGSYSGCGKTTFGERLLGELGKGWAVIKYTKTSFYSSIISNKEVLSTQGKDTARYINAGAEEVLWLQSPPENLPETLPIALERLSIYKGVIIEGNSPIEFFSPDVVVFVDGPERPPKESSKKVKASAHFIVGRDNMDEKIKEIVGAVDRKFDLSVAKVTLKEELLRKAINGKIPCKVLRQIAEAHGISYKEIGEMANSLKIKIIECELGCF